MNPVWLQRNKTRRNQVDALNKGKHDQWLEAKKARGNYKHMHLTMEYYSREDILFYYNLADVFTVFDQHFSSALVGTTTNRHFFWTGKLRVFNLFYHHFK
ncbi:alkaline phosphatase family protein [Flavivirga spongiicola]|uniref:Uncharacterized protein n=1 Tax=Flavivirga spongiicola TaxID=421621 RepID=A0ABU7XND1_9FLAO|nr:alkaline phosphatase family protein [Flavivirga sp. MEBiC05379]MDO5980162.1 alkaline phosphatase family protein [Flavivirga sp. MEBiC05379]MDO5981910.1 alkaline phosphatase family protein [Flavivirga sp. MEBiC05379]